VLIHANDKVAIQIERKAGPRSRALRSSGRSITIAEWLVPDGSRAISYSFAVEYGLKFRIDSVFDHLPIPAEKSSSGPIGTMPAGLIAL
jgi:hypothetical protein